jgi:hypothetical protein
MNLSQLLSIDNYVQWNEIITILAILVVLGYVFFVLNVFKKD